MHLTDLKQLYCKGYTYRGVRLTINQLNEYHWARKRPDSVLCIMIFFSTSIVHHVAETFSTLKSRSIQTISTLFIYHFSQSCDTVINLKSS